MYWDYFKYLVNHKWNVGIECLKVGQFLHSLTHDLSKFRPSEFIPYANFFTGGNNNETLEDFQKGWTLHQNRNKHHWQYWVDIIKKDELCPVPMPYKYVKQMVADWRGMSRKFGDNTKDWYFKNKNAMILHQLTKQRIANIFLGD